MDLAAELQKIYDSEINLRISWLWDGGIDVQLSDEMNGYLAEENVRSVNEIIPCLQQSRGAKRRSGCWPGKLTSVGSPMAARSW